MARTMDRARSASKARDVARLGRYYEAIDKNKEKKLENYLRLLSKVKYEELNTWEKEFYNSVKSKLSSSLNVFLSAKQLLTLNKLGRKTK